MESLTFEQFQDQVMAAFEDWPLRFKDLSEPELPYYTFDTIGGIGFTGHYDNQWMISSNGNGQFGKGETLEDAITNMNKSEVV